MEDVKQILKERQEYLLKIKKQKEKALTKAPEGSLRICSHDGRTQYYRRSDPKNFNGIYMKEKDFPIAMKLAQKDYDKKLLRSAEKELKAIEKYFSNYPKISPEHIYESLHPERQKLIESILETDEQFVQKWESVQYEGKTFKEDVPLLYTAKGERVRSKSEVIIADLLNKEMIPYRYECPLSIRGVGIFHPDFTLLNIRKRKEIYWEHFGMMDDVDYIENALQKIRIYEEHGIFPGENLIITYETRKNPLNQKIVMRMIKHYLK